jgi:DNA-binding CsgD family transcriptional regulator
MLHQTDRSVEGVTERVSTPLPYPLAQPTQARAQSNPGATGFPAPLAEAILGDSPAVPIARLSPRETECLEWTAQGKTTWEIAQILCLSDSTVNYYIRNAMKKLAVHTKAHAVSKAVVLGMFG